MKALDGDVEGAECDAGLLGRGCEAQRDSGGMAAPCPELAGPGEGMTFRSFFANKDECEIRLGEHGERGRLLRESKARWHAACLPDAAGCREQKRGGGGSLQKTPACQGLRGLR